MGAIFELFRNDTFHLVYILVGMALMGLPMIVLTRWYHANIGKTSGGRAAMEWQNAIGAYSKDMGKGIGLARDIGAGKYGRAAREMQNRVYVVVGIWIVVLTLYFGLLIWADEVNKATPAL